MENNPTSPQAIILFIFSLLSKLKLFLQENSCSQMYFLQQRENIRDNLEP